jgi:ferredoxin
MKHKYILEYSSSIVDEPVIYILVKRFDVKVNILRAEINPGHEGSMLVELESDPENIAKSMDYLAERQIKLLPITQSLAFREELCVDCGACTGVCLSGCLCMGGEDWKLVVDRELCIACGLCVKACPFGLFSLKFGD